MVRGKYAVSPRKYVKVSGRRRAWITFQTKEKAVSFIKKRKLKGALLYKRK